ncbi:MAG: alpha/beta hydrolase fold protein [Moraxellaceae bacterium]|jgi:pimeloyl-ACP methyl ester carboxylesterase|nr:alpha/beta hydrolase fold protein [Moraxellaceae bacterium]
MPYLAVDRENSANIELYYEDHGSGPAVVLIHGWPLSGRSWEKQLLALLAAGYRVITYDRRGFGDSAKPACGYDYDTFARDLQELLTQLNVDDATLVGFSMGGGEVARYLGRYGNARVRGAVYIAAITPCLRRAADNPDGVDPQVFADIQAALRRDRPCFLGEFLLDFYNFEDFVGERISDEVVQLSWSIAAMASPLATLDCVSAWGTDFRADLAHVSVPTLIIHGDADRIVPLEASARRLHALLPGSHLAVIAGGPHGLNWTHADEVNQALLEFLEANRPSE